MTDTTIDFDLLTEVGIQTQFYKNFDSMFFQLFISKWEEASAKGMTNSEFFQYWLKTGEIGILKTVEEC